jgi:hypothetical protein
MNRWNGFVIWVFGIIFMTGSAIALYNGLSGWKSRANFAMSLFLFGMAIINTIILPRRGVD